jgi:hypothetical protein
LVRNRGREVRVLKNGWVEMHVDRVVMPWVAADDGEGVGREGAGIVRGGEGGVTREGVELLEERSRVEGATEIKEGCRHCLTLSLFSSHTAGDTREEVEEVEGDEWWMWGEGEALVGGEGTAVRVEGEGVDGDGECCFSSSGLASWSSSSGLAAQECVTWRGCGVCLDCSVEGTVMGGV